jgi:hypothetical protein
MYVYFDFQYLCFASSANRYPSDSHCCDFSWTLYSQLLLLVSELLRSKQWHKLVILFEFIVNYLCTHYFFAFNIWYCVSESVEAVFYVITSFALKCIVVSPFAIGLLMVALFQINEIKVKRTALNLIRSSAFYLAQTRWYAMWHREITKVMIVIDSYDRIKM